MTTNPRTGIEMMDTKDIVLKLDIGLRHKSGMTSDEFIKQYCRVFREHAFATQDDSLNEFEKEITHVLGMLIYYQRFCAILGFSGIDPRDFVWAYEDAASASKEKQEAMAQKLINAALSVVKEGK